MNCENSGPHPHVLGDVEFSIILHGIDIVCGHHITGFEKFSSKLTGLALKWLFQIFNDQLAPSPIPPTLYSPWRSPTATPGNNSPLWRARIMLLWDKCGLKMITKYGVSAEEKGEDSEGLSWRDDIPSRLWEMNAKVWMCPHKIHMLNS